MIPTLRELFSDEYKYLDAGRCVTLSVIGAGGKTSTLFWLADAFYRQGKRVLLTSTTKMYRPAPGSCHHIIIDPQPRLRRENSPSVTALFSREEAETGKVTGFSPQEIDEIHRQGVFDVILTEADGARRLPLKAPAGHEPCIPSLSDCVIALTGGNVLNQPAVEQRIHRWDIFSALTGVSSGERLDCGVFSRFIAHPQGMFKGTPAQARRVWLLNQCYQIDSDLQGALGALLRQNPLLSAVWLGAVQESPPIHTCLRQAIRHTTHPFPDC